MDDELVTLNNKTVEKGFYAIPEILVTRYSVNEKQNYEYRPLVLIISAIEYQFFGPNPAISHFINLVLYILTGVLLFHLLRRIFINYHWILPLTATSLFLIHPIHTEVIASIKNRDEIICFLFVLLSARSFFIYFTEKKNLHLLWGGLFMTLASFTKISGLPYALIIPLFLYFATNIKPKIAFGALFPYLIFCSGLIILILISLIFQNEDFQRNPYFFENPFYQPGYSKMEKFIMAFYSIGYYIKLMFVPYPLIAYYGYSHVTIHGLDLPTILSMIIIFGGVAVCLWKIKTKHPLILGFLMFIISISMFSNFPKPAPGIIAERFAYQASLGFCIMLAWTLLYILKIDIKSSSMKIKIPAKLAGTGAVIALVSFLVVLPRNSEWYSQKTLYHADVKKARKSAKLNSLLASHYSKQLEGYRMQKTPLTAEEIQIVKMYTDSAIHIFRAALKIYPDYIAVNNNLGTIYFTYKNNIDSAGYYFKRALKLDSTYVQAYFNMGSFYENKFTARNELRKFLKSQYKTDSIQGNKSKNGKLHTLPVMKSIEQSILLTIQFRTNVASVLNNFFTTANNNPNAPKQLQQQLANGVENFNSLLPVKETGNVNADTLSKLIVLSMNYTIQTKQLNKVVPRVDSIINANYFSRFAHAIKKEALQSGIAEDEFMHHIYAYSDLLNKEADEMLMGCFEAFGNCLKYDSSYYNAFNKLNTLYSQNNYQQRRIDLNKKYMQLGRFKTSEILINLIFANVELNNVSQALKYLKELENNIILMANRELKAASIFETAGNTGLQARLINNANQRKSSFFEVCQYMYKKFLEKNDNENAARVRDIGEKYKTQTGQ